MKHQNSPTSFVRKTPPSSEEKALLFTLRAPPSSPSRLSHNRPFVKESYSDLQRFPTPTVGGRRKTGCVMEPSGLRGPGPERGERR